MLHTDSFYQKIWKNIINSKEIFYIDSLNNKKSYKELSKNIKKMTHIFLDQKNQSTVIIAKKKFLPLLCHYWNGTFRKYMDTSKFRKSNRKKFKSNIQFKTKINSNRSKIFTRNIRYFRKIEY